MERLQFITNGADSVSTIEGAGLALQGGCRWIQLRMKDASDSEFTKTALELRKLCSNFRATLILDDRVWLVEATGADGVHLGKNDMPVDQARSILGFGKIIGATANNLTDMVHADESGADYIGLGPFKFTTTKKNLSPVIGLDGYRELMTRFRASGHTIPVVAIGGIEPEDIQPIIQSGVDGIALSGTILRAPDPVVRTKEILNKL